MLRTPLRLTEPDMANAKAYDAWNTRMEMSRGKIEFIAAKNRNGPTDDVPLRFIDYAMRFVERTGGEEEPDSP